MAARQQHAAVLAIGTANPAKCVVAQEEFVDWYFRVTQSDHLPDLKAKMKRMYEDEDEDEDLSVLCKMRL
ncbi:hypothetical protein OsI_36338 [Oryza sativa Indica Group]|uniref:Chalcone/stilbene synthase N-terminal domain-containing protein n=1 Tax=Oryza sativa subsp. indica TaxID=39946 RepID=B8BKV1_ORYSI|nr:hypothetical protein OsI_36338 [Oryza sativa Indica Group]